MRTPRVAGQATLPARAARAKNNFEIAVVSLNHTLANMRRTRRIRGPVGLKSLDDAYRSIHMRNIRINYSLNHEWEQLNREIWVRVAEMVNLFLYAVFTRGRFHLARGKYGVVRARENRPYALDAEGNIPYSAY